MDLSSFLTSLVTSFIIFLFLVILFVWLSRRPANDVVYYPCRILRGQDGSEGRSGRANHPFAWIGEATSSSEEQIMEMAGVDATVYLLFLRTALATLFISGILLLPVLLPVAKTDGNLNGNLKSSNGSTLTFSAIDQLAMGNIKEKSPRLWLFLVGTYWVTLVSFFLLWRAYQHASNLRKSAKAAQERPEDFAILVRDIPPVPQGQTRKEQVDSYFRSLYPETFYRSMIITDNKQVTKIWAQIELHRKNLARAETVFAESKTPSNPEGTRPVNRTGFLGFIGKTVDTIDDSNTKIDQLLAELESEKKLTLREKQQNAALIFFNSRASALSASQTVHAQMVDSWTVMEAPEPRQLLWTNLSKSFYERKIRQCMVYSVVFITVIFYMIPIAFVSAFTTLKNLKKLLPFLEAVIEQTAIKTMLEAYLPQIALIVFMALLPGFLMFLSKMEGIPSESNAVRAASGKYYYFIVFNVFIGVTIGGTLFSSLKVIQRNPEYIVAMLGGSLPGNASFFLTIVALKFFVEHGLELSRVVPLIIYHLKRKYMCKTEEDLKEAWAPGDFEYATRVPNDMLILTIVLCYSVIAPLIIPFGIMYFGIGWVVLRNQALKVYVASYESNGRMWPHMFGRFVAAVFLYQLTMIGYFGVKKFYYAPLLVPLPILTITFAYICHSRFYLAFLYTPMEVTCRNTTQASNMQYIYTAYIPPWLGTEEKFSDSDTFEDALSQVCRTPTADTNSNINNA